MKRKLLFLAEGILLLVLLVLCFFGSDNVIVTNYQELHRDEETGCLVSGEFTLRPGVYRITVETDAAGGGIGDGMEISMIADQMTFHAIRGNKATLYAGTEHKEITYYVTAKVTSARLSVLPFSEEAPVSYELKVERTTAGHRMVFVMTLLLCAVLDGLILFHEKIMTGEVGTQKKWAICALVGIWAAACIPLMVDYLILGTDSVQCLKETEYLLRKDFGNIPALHLVYLWIPAVVRCIGFPVMTAYKVLLAVLIAGSVILFYGVLSGKEKDVRVSLLITAFGIWNPLAMKLLYSQGNPGKFILYMIGYVALCGIVRWFRGKNKANYKVSPWILFAIALVLVLQVLYFEDRLTFESDVYYWYNEEPFMTGE